MGDTPKPQFLTFSGAEKEAKRHPPIPSPSLYGRGVTAPPVALTLRYVDLRSPSSLQGIAQTSLALLLLRASARTIKGPACFFIGYRTDYWADYHKRVYPFPVHSLWSSHLSPQCEPLFKGRRQRGCRKEWRTPKGQRLESHTKTLTEGGLCPESITSSCQRLARGLESGSRSSLGQGG